LNTRRRLDPVLDQAFSVGTELPVSLRHLVWWDFQVGGLSCVSWSGGWYVVVYWASQYASIFFQWSAEKGAECVDLDWSVFTCFGVSHLRGCESVTCSGLGGLGCLSGSSLGSWSGGIVIQVVVVVVIRDPCADCLEFRSQNWSARSLVRSRAQS
jgi:hypothetical protein